MLLPWGRRGRSELGRPRRRSVPGGREGGKGGREGGVGTWIGNQRPTPFLSLSLLKAAISHYPLPPSLLSYLQVLISLPPRLHEQLTARLRHSDQTMLDRVRGREGGRDRRGRRGGEGGGGGRGGDEGNGEETQVGGRETDEEGAYVEG